MSTSDSETESLAELDFGLFKVNNIFKDSEQTDVISDDSFDEIVGCSVELTASDNAANTEIQRMLRDLGNVSEDDAIPPSPANYISTKERSSHVEINNGSSTDTETMAKQIFESKEIINQVEVEENQPKKRFRTVSDEERKEIEKSAQSKSTQKNTLWGLRIFQDWSTEVYGSPTEMETIPPECLANKLGKFYCEATPKNVNKRNESLNKQQAEVYHKNCLINIRAAINRHLQNLKRNFDIVRDKEFRQANKTLDGLLKVRMKNGASRPTKHKEIRPENDMKQISTYLQGAPLSPYVPRQAVWFTLAIHFVSRGLEFHKQLRRDSFNFSQDEHGEYVELNHLTLEKNYRGGISKSEGENTAKRMYAVKSSGQQCPVALLKLLIEKTDPSAPMLFNQYVKNARPSDDIWFTGKALSPRTFSNFMSEICKCSGITKYTAHSLRATAISAMNASGYEARHIMFMSGHRSEASIRSYNRSCTDQQKRSLSETLSSVAFGESTDDMSIRSNQRTGALCQLPPHTITQPEQSVDRISVDPSQSGNHLPYPGSIMTNQTTTGMLTNSVFHGCTFNFSK